MAYDVALDIVDNANGDCSLAFMVRDDVYSQQDVAQLANSYVGLAKAFAAQPATTVGNAAVFDEVEVEEALKFGRGKTSTFLMRNWTLLFFPSRAQANIFLSYLRAILSVTSVGQYDSPSS